MSERINKFLKGELATSILYVILGLCLVLMPVGTVYFFCKIIFGVVMIGTGLYQIWKYLREKPGVTVIDLFAGGILLVLGGFLFFNPQIVVKILPVLMGMFILIDSVWTIKGAVRMKKKNQPIWKSLLIGSLIFIAIAIVLMINPFELSFTFLIAGWALLANGIVDLVFLFMLRRGAKQADGAIDGTFEDIKNGGGAEETAGRQDTSGGTSGTVDLNNVEEASGEKETGTSQEKPSPVELTLDPQIQQEGPSSASAEAPEISGEKAPGEETPEEKAPGEETLEEWKD